jgi:Cu/Ag efflux protein CusF
MPSQSLSRMRGQIIGLARHVCDRAIERRYLLMWRVSLVLSLVALTGCGTAYSPPVLTTQHPAHPEATAAPDLPPSKTLAYTSADIPSPRPSVATAPRRTDGASSSAPKSQQTVVGEGKVIAVVPGSSEIVLTHSEIKGFMEAMTMGYPIQPASLLEGVQAGDRVRFAIDTEQKAIVRLEKLKP